MGLRRRHLLALSALAGWAGLKEAAAAEMLRLAGVERDPVSWVAAALMADICREAGLMLQVEPAPAQRASLMSASGQVDGELVRIQAYGLSHPQLVRVDPAFYRIGVVAVSLASRNAVILEPADLGRYTVGVIRGLHYAEELTEKHASVTLAQNSEQMFRMLQAGRVDVVLDSAWAARASLERLAMTDVVVSRDLVRYELFAYLNPRLRSLAPRLGEAIRRLKATGELERMTSRHEAAMTATDVEHFIGRT